VKPYKKSLNGTQALKNKHVIKPILSVALRKRYEKLTLLIQTQRKIAKAQSTKQFSILTG
jgi:hypothetical protein